MPGRDSEVRDAAPTQAGGWFQLGMLRGWPCGRQRAVKGVSQESDSKRGKQVVTADSPRQSSFSLPVFGLSAAVELAAAHLLRAAAARTHC